MAQISTYGYSSIRQYAQTTWQYLEVQKQDGTPLKRFTLSDGLTITQVGNTIEYVIIINGNDPLFSNQTVSKSVIFDVATGGQAIAVESFTDFTFESTDDQLTIKHTIQVPQL